MRDPPMHDSTRFCRYRWLVESRIHDPEASLASHQYPGWEWSPKQTKSLKPPTAQCRPEIGGNNCISSF